MMVDRVQRQQVFMNLMLNAIEAMKVSGGELTMKSELQNGQLRFSVTDTGIGLPTEKMDRILSAFFTTKPPGSGTGLAIRGSIVESHGGQLWANANGGGGATFHFTLPIPVTGSSPGVIARGHRPWLPEILLRFVTFRTQQRGIRNTVD
jgi:signal transduction histidine kinase